MPAKKKVYISQLPKTAKYRGMNMKGDGLWDDIVDGSKYIFKKAKGIYEWIRENKPIGKLNSMLNMTPGADLFVNSIPVIGPGLRSAVKSGAEWGFGKKVGRPRRVGRPKKK